MVIENILIIDTETSGLEPQKGAKLIEIGALLYNVKHKQILQTLSTFLPCDENPVQHINHIDAEWTRCNMGTLAAVHFLYEMADHASFLVAHNAHFDEKFLNTYPLDSKFRERKWICTKRDFEWPVQLFRNRLEDICSAMGVNYVNAHRALTDCTFLASCFGKISDLEQRLECAGQIVMKNDIRCGNTFR
jgi:DNA polymerase-3 subunit epsilon